jgi:membrane protein YdbS with pleckstrin-like domain
MIRATPEKKESLVNRTVQIVLIVILLLLLLGLLPTWPYSSGWGYYPSGGIGLLLLVVLIVLIVGGRGRNLD